MSNDTIKQVTLDAFQQGVIHLVQQKATKLRAWVDDWSPDAETGNWDRLGAAEAGIKTRRMATPEMDRVWSRRTAIASPYNDAEIIEQEDPTRMLEDPKSHIIRSIGYSMGRKMDDIIIGAAVGNATNSVRASDGSNTPTDIALPAGQILGDYGTPISFDVITNVVEIFNSHDLEDVEIVAVVGPRQVRELMNLTEVTSADYVMANALMSNKIVSGWYGMDWVMSNRLIHPTTAQTQCLFMTRDAVGFHIPQDVTTKCSEDPGLSYAWRPYAQFDAGAVRLEEEKVVTFEALDASIA